MEKKICIFYQVVSGHLSSLNSTNQKLAPSGRYFVFHSVQGVYDKLGSIEVGKLADIVAMDGDPLKDPLAFGKVVFVMKDGVVYKN